MREGRPELDPNESGRSFQTPPLEQAVCILAAVRTAVRLLSVSPPTAIAFAFSRRRKVEPCCITIFSQNLVFMTQPLILGCELTSRQQHTAVDGNDG